MNEQERKAELARQLNAHPNLAPSGVIDVGYMLADLLIGSVADAGTAVDTGAGMGSFDLWVKSGGREYYINVRESGNQKAAVA